MINRVGDTKLSTLFTYFDCKSLINVATLNVFPPMWKTFQILSLLCNFNWDLEKEIPRIQIF